jgi:starvation-inducible outer membrane lipoprotein
MKFLAPCLVALLLAACSNEPEYTAGQRACITERHKVYNERQLDQCVDVCKGCMGGSTVTCNTSCKLKGAS